MEDSKQPIDRRERRTLRRWVILILLVAVVAVIGWWLHSLDGLPIYGVTPSYGGLTAEQWLPEISGQNSQTALKAFQGMGPDALPFLVRAMGRKEIKWPPWYMNAYPKLPKWLRNRIRPPYAQTPIAVAWTSARIALERQTNAHSALPALAKMLSDPGIWSHTHIAGAISKLAKEGDTGYVRNLAKGLQDRDPQVRLYVAGTLEKIGAPANEAIPQLKAALNDPAPDTRIIVAWALWNLAHETNACRDSLISAIRAGPSNPLDQRAIFYVMEIEPHSRALVPVLIERMSKEPEAAQVWDCGILTQIGPPAKAAVPLLEERVKKGGPALQNAAAAALNSIGPGAAKEEKH